MSLFKKSYEIFTVRCKNIQHQRIILKTEKGMRLVCLAVEAVAAVKNFLFSVYICFKCALDDIAALTVWMRMFSTKHSFLPLQLAYHKVIYVSLDGADNTVIKSYFVFLFVSSYIPTLSLRMILFFCMKNIIYLNQIYVKYINIIHTI